MHQLHTKSLCSKNKTYISHKNITRWIFTANQCDFCCCFSINKFRNTLLHLSKCHSQIIFATKSVPFISFNIYQPRNWLFAKIRCNKRCEYLEGFLSSKRVGYDLVTPKRWERCCSEELLLKLALLRFNDFVDICCRNTKRERLSHPW